MTSSPGSVDAATLRSWLGDGREIALLDVREAGSFGDGHIFRSVPLPYSRFELDLERLAPRRAVRLVLTAGGAGAGPQGDELARRAARRALALGYRDVHVLAGGVSAWQAAGHRLVRGVNVVSKAFGEWVEHAFATPSILPEELQRRMARGDDIVLLDGRTAEEHRTMSIPGAICCPNGELASRIAELAPDPATTIVVHCAGRTRSIIGAETLRRIGLPNPVLALRNGTMGWRLAGFDLAHGAAPAELAAPSPAHARQLREQATILAGRLRVPLLTAATAQAWLADAGRTTYLLDVRSLDEFARGSAPGAVHAPGGQLIQATDRWLGVRAARAILLDDLAIRAVAAAHWLRLMGWEAAALDTGAAGWRSLGSEQPAAELPLPEPEPIEAADLARLPHAPVILDLRSSMAYRASHVAGARWAIRPLAAAAVRDIPPGPAPIVLAAAEPGMAALFAAELAEPDRARCRLLSGTVEDWRAAGLPIEATPALPADRDCIDFLFFLHDRHAGNLDSARRYLDWETGLLRALDPDERASFRRDLLPAGSNMAISRPTLEPF